MSKPSSPLDRDLVSISEARAQARRAKAVQPRLEQLTQKQIDKLVDSMATAVEREAESLAALAVEETGFGVVALSLIHI